MSYFDWYFWGIESLDEDNGNEFSNSGGRLSLFTLGKKIPFLDRADIKKSMIQIIHRMNGLYL